MGNNINVCFEFDEKPRDPITLSDLDDHKFVFTRELPGGQEINVEYNVSSLVDYFLTSGDFVEPETRLELSDEDLQRLDAQAIKAGYKKSSVFEAKRNPGYFLEQKDRRDALIGLEGLTGETVGKMMTVIEKMSYEEGQMDLVINLFPAFTDYFKQMEKIDKEYSAQSLRHYQLYLKGPPNKPTKDTSGLLQVVQSFLKEIQEGKISCQDYGFPSYS